MGDGGADHGDADPDRIVGGSPQPGRGGRRRSEVGEWRIPRRNLGDGDGCEVVKVKCEVSETGRALFVLKPSVTYVFRGLSSPTRAS